MNKTIKNILERTSCRQYTAKKVPASKLNQILEAGKMAPSGMNRQIANILCVKTKKYVERLRELSIAVRGRDCYYGANTMIIVYGPKDDPFTSQDCSCVLENLFVASTALGVQSCWINQTEELLSSDQGKKVRKLLGIGEEYRVVGTCVVGYSPDGRNPDPKPRREDFVRVK